MLDRIKTDVELLLKNMDLKDHTDRFYLMGYLHSIRSNAVNMWFEELITYEQHNDIKEYIDKIIDDIYR